MKNQKKRSKSLVLMTLTLSLIMLVGCNSEIKNSDNIASEAVLSATGILISEESATLSPPSISSMWQFKLQYLAKENTKVKTGDVVIRFDPMQLRNDLMSKQSELNAAIKELEKSVLDQEQVLEDLKLALAEAKMNNEKEKRKAEIVDAARSRIERDKQKKSYEIAQLKLLQAEQRITNFYASKSINNEVSESTINRLNVEVNRIKADIERLNVKATKPGIIMYKADHRGEKPAVGETVWQGRSLLTIPSLDKIAIQAQFDEPDTNKVAVGALVKVTLDAYPEHPFMGKITTLGQSYKHKSRQNPKVVFDVFIQIDNIDMEIMRPGMKVKVELVSSTDSVGEIS